MLLVWKSKFTYHPGQESITRTSIILPIKLVALLCAALFFGQKPLTWCFTNLKFYLCSKDMFLLFFFLGKCFPQHILCAPSICDIRCCLLICSFSPQLLLEMNQRCSHIHEGNFHSPGALSVTFNKENLSTHRQKAFWPKVIK